MPITYPESLPVSQRASEIKSALRAHQVVIVCGETGSGKTTQLPKMMLEWLLEQAKPTGPAGAAVGAAADARSKPRLIGHTQPRRIAATSIARRIAEELQTPLGEVVGYKVRFNDRLSSTTRIKLMTDGILLAETQTDRDLRQYAALIIDEAHERSLNIDFLLGYLKQLLPRRLDLKVIITSATIDADRFARHFACAEGRPAPVLQVSGRTYPVDIRYRPFQEGQERQERDTNIAIAQAVDALWREGQGVQGAQNRGDILVFLSGEREIREAADHLRGHLLHHPVLKSAQIIPLFSRLSQAEQERVFAPHSEPHIVLATNVAETSLTVPGVRYVIDTGLARIKRYSYRNKVDQLPIEPISQAAAHQRAGRSGRLAHGICIRLYDEADFASRPPFSEPEILRSSLASVILRMMSLDLGPIEAFPFIEPPSGRAVADGYQLLQELGAVEESNATALTPLGQELARLPLDPRIGRMVLAASRQGHPGQANLLAPVLVIAASLCVPDVRDRPIERQAAADQAHAAFQDERSEFLGTLRLWDWIAAAPASESKRQFEARLREHFINARRVREWRDTHAQLLQIVQSSGLERATNSAATGFSERGYPYEGLHQCLLAGLLGNIGCKHEEDDGYLGARGIRFYKHPGVRLKKKPGRWIMCSELVQTSRLFGRGIANIDPAWLEPIAAHLIKRQLLDPHWEKKSTQVVAFERATLYGLVIYSGRRVDYAKADPSGARELFIRQALVAGQWEPDAKDAPFLVHNRRLIQNIEEMEHQSRRQDVLVDDELIYAYYDQTLPLEVCNAHQLLRWYKTASRNEPALLHLTRQVLMRHEAAGITTERFPLRIRLGGVDCKASYLHDPQSPRDGLSVDVPLFALNQVSDERLAWLVPGMLKDKIQALLKTLPQRPRSRLLPLSETAQRLATHLSDPHRFAHGGLIESLLLKVREQTGLTDLKATDFKPDLLPAHHHGNLRVLDAHERQLGMGRNLDALKAELGAEARGAFAALAALAKREIETPTSFSPTTKAAPTAHKVTPTASTTTASGERHTTWDFGELPELMEVSSEGSGAQTLIGFPALVDQDDAVSLEVFDSPDLASSKHRVGLRRLVSLQIKDALKYLDKNVPDLQKLAIGYMPLGGAEDLKAQLLAVALDRAFLADPLPTDAASFEARLSQGRARLNLIAAEIARLVGVILAEYSAVLRKMKDARAATEPLADITQQLARLMPKHFVTLTPYEALQHYPRYLKAITLRLEKCRNDPARDAQQCAQLRPVESRYLRKWAERKGQEDARLSQYRWLLEELRVSLFAQELRTPQPVSIKRLDKAWQGCA